MERFDLSYQIEADEPGDHPTRSLVPQLLPFQPPIALPAWPETPPTGQNLVQMIYRLDFVPAGIMSWFVVRTHRYTKDLHWREGVLLAYEQHEARVELNPLTRELRMVVAGVQPQNFLSILMHTADLILRRFEGLKVERVVPCICHWQRNDPQPCSYAHPYDYLVRLIEKGRETAECREHLEEVPVLTLLYGIHPSTNQQVMRDVQESQQQIFKRLGKLDLLDELLARQQQLSELVARNFTRQWNLEMHRLEAECPNTFCLMPGSRREWNPRNWFGVEYRMYLLCQHPPRPHIHGEGYPLRQSKEWWSQVKPWLGHLVRFLKFGVPLGAAIEGVYDAATAKQFEAEIKLMEQMVASLPVLGDGGHPRSLADTQGRTQEAEGAALRALHGLLRTLDPAEHWADLRRTPTPDGNILWLCAEHRAVYEVKPLILPEIEN